MLIMNGKTDNGYWIKTWIPSWSALANIAQQIEKIAQMSDEGSTISIQNSNVAKDLKGLSEDMNCRIHEYKV